MKQIFALFLGGLVVWLLFFRKKTTAVSSTATSSSPAPISIGEVKKLISDVALTTPEPTLVNPAKAANENIAALTGVNEIKTSNQNMAEALAQQAQLQQQEQDRLAAQDNLLKIQAQIDLSHASNISVDSSLLQSEQAAKEALTTLNTQKANSDSILAGNTFKAPQYDASNSPELARLNAFLLVKQDAVNSAVSEMDRLSTIQMLNSIEDHLRTAVKYRIDGWDQSAIDGETNVAAMQQATLNASIAARQSLYVQSLADQARQKRAAEINNELANLKLSDFPDVESFQAKQQALITESMGL